MTRILLVETASPKRIRWKAEQIKKSGVYPAPDITILCQPDNVPFYSEIPDVQAVPFPIYRQRKILKEINRRQFDAIYVFWTGERRRRAKLFALRLKSPNTYVISGDGGEFRLTWKAICRHSIFRWKHPLPTDHYEFVQTQQASIHQGDRVLIIQSAEPPHILAALERMREKPLFRNPIYTVFCRYKGDAIAIFQEHPMIHRTIIHVETSDSWMHWKSLRRERFDVVVVFFTGDPSYRKIKFFAFTLGARHKLIFNESNDCFFFTWRQWLALILHRLDERPRPEAWPRWRYQLRSIASWHIKLAALPFRFLWLLLIWTQLRLAGILTPRKKYDRSL
jgi:ADP-heptose:LPS heptosyltransferase